MKAVELQSVSYSIGSRRILDSISFSVDEGVVFALVGPSGCGKSTTLRLVSGLDDSSSGEVLVYGRQASEYRGVGRRVITVWQHLALFPHLSVGENIGFGLRVRRVSARERRRRIEETCRLVRLDCGLDRPLAGLSGGELQRVAIGRAVILEPHVLLLDEPFTGLDPRLKLLLQADLRDLIHSLGCTYIIVTHSLREVFALADRMAVMSEGKIVQEGIPDEIYRSPKNAFVADFMGGRNLLEGVVRGFSSEGEKAIVETPLGVFEGVNSGEVATGAEVVYAVSFYDLLLNKKGDCTTDCEYRAAEREGRREVLYFRGRDGIELRIERVIAGNSQELGVAIGESVSLSWNSDDALVLEC